MSFEVSIVDDLFEYTFVSIAAVREIAFDFHKHFRKEVRDGTSCLQKQTVEWVIRKLFTILFQSVR